MESLPPIVVSFASQGRENYNAGLLRLAKSLKTHWSGHIKLYSFDGYVDEYAGVPIELCGGAQVPQPSKFICSHHSQIPYQFKFGIIQKMREQGYKKILWLDSAMVMEIDCVALFERSSNGIIAFHNLGHDLYKYISDIATHNLNQSESTIKEIKQTWGGAIGFDFDNEIAANIFDEIVRQSQIGSFNDGNSVRDGFIAHRHDQAVMSVLFAQNNVELLPYGTIVTHPHYLPPYEYGESFYISHRPI